MEGEQPKSPLRIGILVVAYNAASTLAAVLDRIPPDVRRRVADVLVFDDHSADTTYLVGLGYKSIATDLPITVIRHPRNIGYGGNQKAGYRMALERGLDIIVLLHADAQYAPESLEDLLGPLERGEADAVLGSRMLEPGAARRGGMPLYKYVGNRVLSRFQNAVVGTHFSEWHSGYRAYRTSAIGAIPFERNSDGFDFDTEITIQLHEAGARIVEVPIPTYYGGEIHYVNGLRYAGDVTRDVIAYRAQRLGFGSGHLVRAPESYLGKHRDETSHGVLLSWLSAMQPGRVLDFGCSSGELSSRIRKLGHRVTGVDVCEVGGVREAVDEFFLVDPSGVLPAAVGGRFDVVVVADVLEHAQDPELMLHRLGKVVAPNGTVLVSVPNFVHWYSRLRVLFGLFDYDRRGILDSSHLRFFTRRSFQRLAVAAGYKVVRLRPVGLPIEILERRGQRHRPRLTSLVKEGAAAADAFLASTWPNLFAYQYVLELAPITVVEDNAHEVELTAGRHTGRRRRLVGTRLPSRRRAGYGAVS